MTYVISNAWALLLGVMMLQLGNGMQGTLLAVRGETEGFDPTTLSIIMAGYFVGFLGGSRVTPALIRRVGHVRVFAALASFISAIFILYPAVPDPWAWTILRIAVGFCFSGVYVAAESWLNDVSTNETRGQVLSAYLVVQVLGIIAAQALVVFGDPNGYLLFIAISVAVSLSFAPILLSISPVPAFEATKPMTLRELFDASPLGIVGMFFLGAIFGSMFGMSAVYGTAKGMSVSEISLFVGVIYVGSLVCQFPIGYISDHMDRRRLIMLVTGIGAALILACGPFLSDFRVILAAGFVIGAIAMPLYSLLLAYTNDYLSHEDMAAAAGGLVFITGAGSIFGPIGAGWLITNTGADTYFIFIAMQFLLIALYAAYRTTQRAAPSVEDTAAFSPLTPTATPVAVELASEIAVDLAIEAEEQAEDEGGK